MELDQYIQDMYNGQNVRFREIADDDPEGTLELFDRANVDNTYNRILIDSSDAADLLENKSDPIDHIESAIRLIDFADQYGAGYEGMNEEATKIGLRNNNSDATDKFSDKKEQYEGKAKLQDKIAAGSGLGFLGSAALGSGHGMGIFSLTGIVSSSLSARNQGARNGWAEEAVNGLEDQYGNYKVKIT